MGFFSKIKENINHGGVKIELSAPDRIEKNQSNIPIQVRISAADTPRRVLSVTARLERRYYSNNDQGPNQPDVLAGQDNTTPFELPAGQTVYLDFNLSLDLTQNVPGQNQALGQVAGMLDTFGRALNTAQGQSFSHYVTVIADIDEIRIDPQASKKIILDGKEQSHFRITM